MVDHLELPRPRQLLRTAGWSMAESLGLPGLGYLAGYFLGGQVAAVLAGTGVLWVIIIARKVLTGGVTAMLMLTALAMSIQAALVIATGNVWLFLLQFPLSHLALALVFARTAQQRKPLIARLAAEVIALRQPSTHHPGLHRFFQGATWLWAGIFFALTVCMAVMMVTESVGAFLVLTTAATVGLVMLGIILSGLWFYGMLRRTGLRLRFAAAR